MASGRPGAFGSVRTWQRTARRALTPDLRWMWPSGRSSPRLVRAARCPVRCCHRRVRCCPRFRGRFTRWVLVSWARFTRWVPGGGLLVRAGAGGRPGAASANRAVLGGFTRNVSLGVDCVLLGTGSVPVPGATVEVAVLGVAPEDGRLGACSAVGGFWLRSRRRRRTGCVQEGVLLGGVGPDRRAARSGRPSGVPLGGPGPLLGRADGASARIFDGCAPPCARSPALYRRAAVCAS